jgi:integrase
MEVKMEHTTLKMLSESVINELGRLNYSPATIEYFRWMYRKLHAYGERHQAREFSIAFGVQWLKDDFNIDIAAVTEGADRIERKKQLRPLRAFQCLVDWDLHGCITLKRPGKLKAQAVPAQFKTGYDSFIALCNGSGYSARGTYSRLNRIKRMLIFFDTHGVHDFKAVNAMDIHAFFKTQIELDSRTVATMLTSARVFLRHLFREGLLAEDLTEKLPAVKANRGYRLPKLWNQNDILAILASIDRGNPVGKRDYAILLLITRYGMRSSDVKSIELSDFHWNDGYISIVQSKTRTPLRLPLLKDVGWALIDYLKNGRPPSDLPQVFLTCTIPIRAFGQNSGALNAILAKRIRAAGVSVPRDVTQGLHSLRHTLASLMLANNVDLPVISSVLGHGTSQATSVYLHTDLTRLAECALDPEEVYSHVDD